MTELGDIPVPCPICKTYGEVRVERVGHLGSAFPPNRCYFSYQLVWSRARWRTDDQRLVTCPLCGGVGEISPALGAAVALSCDPNGVGVAFRPFFHELYKIRRAVWPRSSLK